MGASLRYEACKPESFPGVGLNRAIRRNQLLSRPHFAPACVFEGPATAMEDCEHEVAPRTRSVRVP
jgi:hypothetical protein